MGKLFAGIFTLTFSKSKSRSTASESQICCYCSDFCVAVILKDEVSRDIVVLRENGEKIYIPVIIALSS